MRAPGYSPNVLRFGLQDRPGFWPIEVRNARVALSIWPQFCAWPGSPLVGSVRAHRVRVVGEPLQVLLAGERAEGPAVDGP